ncbi:MAG: hypothetical protein K2K81_10805 [Muribaculaceae bacterium]|nr:hypothetical protein [Muribaculaceae bacterium]MDE6410713.1 hypothetical protein [Muribaculaceae bacterium]
METFDSLKPQDQVSVTIWGPEDSRLYQSTNTGYHTVEEAVREAIANAGLEINPEDCVFEVRNDNTLVSHKYRFNAHGNLVLEV